MEGVRGFAEQEHGGDLPFDESARHTAKKKTTQAPPVKLSQDINLVQFTRETRNATVVWHSLGKTNRLASVIFHDEAKPTSVDDCERVVPLAFSEFI